MALPTDILTIIDDLRRRVDDLERSPQPPSIALTDTAAASFSLSAAGVSGDSVSFTVTIANDQGKRILSMPSISLYKDSISTANLFPFGSNWTANQAANVSFTVWNDWGSTDNNNAALLVNIVNKTTSSISNLLIRVNSRFLLQEGSV